MRLPEAQRAHREGTVVTKRNGALKGHRLVIETPPGYDQADPFRVLVRHEGGTFRGPVRFSDLVTIPEFTAREERRRIFDEAAENEAEAVKGLLSKALRARNVPGLVKRRRSSSLPPQQAQRIEVHLSTGQAWALLRALEAAT